MGGGLTEQGTSMAPSASLDTTLISLVRDAAGVGGIDYSLLAALVEQESGWNQWAVRYEPAFFSKYISPIYTAGKINATEAWLRAYSWGLGQILGEVARELGFTGPFLPELCDPATNLKYVCLKLKKCLDRNNGDVTKALQEYNGGSNPTYAQQVQDRVKHYS